MNTALQEILENRKIYNVVHGLLVDGKITKTNDTLSIPIYNDNSIISNQYINLIKPFKLFKKGKSSKGYFAVMDGLDDKMFITECFTDLCSLLAVKPDINVACIFTAGNIDVLKLKHFSKYHLISFMDNDKAGQEANINLHKMKLNISYARWGIIREKDVNELLMAGKDDEIKILMNDAVSSPYITGLYNSLEVYQSNIPEPNMIIPEFLPEGLTILAAMPKRGKSFLCMNIANMIAEGRVFGKWDVEPCRVLFLGLEDTPRRIKGRLRKYLPSEDFASPMISFMNKWRRIGDGCVEDIQSYLFTYPNTKYIVIDTLEKIAPETARNGSKGIYAGDYSKIAALKEIADEKGIAIQCVHHLNKSESDDILNHISGSTGLTGASDTNMILNRQIKSADARLYISGRDIQEYDYALEFDKEMCLWSIKGDAVDFEISPELTKILQVFRKYPLTTFTTTSVNEVLAEDGNGKNENTLKNQLNELVSQGKIKRVSKGKYILE